MTKFKQFLVPAVIILMGAGAAFATNTSQKSQSTETGYYLDEFTEECKRSPVQCSTSGTTICTWSDGPNTHILYRNGTACTEEMYRIDN